MASLEIRLTGFDEVIALLERIDRNFDNLDPMKRAFGEIVREAIQSYIELGGTYERVGGSVMPPTNWAYAELEGKGHQRPLFWTGDLYHSIVYALTAQGVEVGSDLDYAPWVMLADGYTPRHYARELVNSHWVPRGAVIEGGGGFAALPPGFVKYQTTIQKRDVLEIFDEDAAALLDWFERVVIQ